MTATALAPFRTAQPPARRARPAAGARVDEPSAASSPGHTRRRTRPSRGVRGAPQLCAVLPRQLPDHAGLLAQGPPGEAAVRRPRGIAGRLASGQRAAGNADLAAAPRSQAPVSVVGGCRVCSSSSKSKLCARTCRTISAELGRGGTARFSRTGFAVTDRGRSHSTALSLASRTGRTTSP